MNFEVDKKIFDQYPSLNIGVIVAKGIDNIGKNSEILSMISEQVNLIKSNHSIDTYKQLPKINAWKEVYRSFGAKPKKYSSSVENLYRMIFEGAELRHINKVVDIYNYISLKYTIPVGGDDTNKVDGNISLRFATGEEKFICLNSTKVDHPKSGEVIYVDEKEVLCRRWNWRECDKSKMTEQTKNVILAVEAIPPVSKYEVQKIIRDLGGLVKKICGGEIIEHIINDQNKKIDF